MTKGKIGESLAAAKFLEKGFEVFTTVEDNNNTDMIVAPHLKSGNKLEKNLLRIQVKTSFTDKNQFYVRKIPTNVDYYFLLNRKTRNFWIVPEDKIRDYNSRRQLRGKRRDTTLAIKEKDWKEYEEFNYLIMKLEFDPNPKHRSDGQIGKVGERLAIAKFLEEEYDVYEIISDTKAVDFVVGKEGGFFNVQVKYSPKNYHFRNIGKKKEHPNYWYLLIKGGDPEEYFFISSMEMKKIAKSGSILLREKEKENYRWS